MNTFEMTQTEINKISDQRIFTSEFKKGSLVKLPNGQSGIVEKMIAFKGDHYTDHLVNGRWFRSFELTSIQSSDEMEAEFQQDYENHLEWLNHVNGN